MLPYYMATDWPRSLFALAFRVFLPFGQPMPSSHPFLVQPWFQLTIDSNTRTLAIHTHCSSAHTHCSYAHTLLFFTYYSFHLFFHLVACVIIPTVCAHIVAPSVPRDLRPTCWHISARNLERRWASLHIENFLHSKNKCICRTDPFFFSLSIWQRLWQQASQTFS